MRCNSYHLLWTKSPGQRAEPTGSWRHCWGFGDPKAGAAHRLFLLPAEYYVPALLQRCRIWPNGGRAPLMDPGSPHLAVCLLSGLDRGLRLASVGDRSRSLYPGSAVTAEAPGRCRADSTRIGVLSGLPFSPLSKSLTLTKNYLNLVDIPQKLSEKVGGKSPIWYIWRYEQPNIPYRYDRPPMGLYPKSHTAAKTGRSAA
jgi:hypothetical protein